MDLFRMVIFVYVPMHSDTSVRSQVLTETTAPKNVEETPGKPVGQLMGSSWMSTLWTDVRV